MRSSGVVGAGTADVSGPAPTSWVGIASAPRKAAINPSRMVCGSRKVRFREPQTIRDGLIAALRGALAIPTQLVGAGPLTSAVPAPTTPELRIDDLPSARIFHYPALPGIP